MIDIHLITPERQAALHLPNEDFPLIGQLLPSYKEGVWSYQERLLADHDISLMRFPDETYDLQQINQAGFALGAFDKETCLGLAIFQDGFFAYSYLADLKVASAYRGQGIASQLLDRGRQIAKERGSRGIYTIGQDNNLIACRFYLAYGFQIGGLDTRVYTGTAQEGKANIYFYLDH